MPTTSLFEVRRFDGCDEPAVVDVWFRSGKATYSFLPGWQKMTRAQAIEIFRNEIMKRCDVWVAKKNGRVVGYLAMKDSYIDRLYVDPELQRDGCGTQLLNFAKTMWPRGLRLHTHQQNTGARAFYEKHGFSAVAFGVSPAPECAPDVEYCWNGDSRQAGN
jgi:ribosomal protein S18 acetylase RimI-like enzyme